tara:strand:+ start:503 stop:670 length:168 start_codon:yes stop_codon:yes gene_type:complete
MFINLFLSEKKYIIYVKNKRITVPRLTSEEYPPSLGTKYAISSGLKLIIDELISR